VALYLLCGVGGSVCALLLTPGGLSAGASTSVFGLFGALLLFIRKLRLDARSLMMLVALNFSIGFFVSNISWQGHLGGLVTGALVGGVLAYAPKGPHRTAVQIVGLAIVAVALAGLAVYGAA
jgi:membrane associated rhomboid family serine protease